MEVTVMVERMQSNFLKKEGQSKASGTECSIVPFWKQHR